MSKSKKRPPAPPAADSGAAAADGAARFGDLFRRGTGLLHRRQAAAAVPYLEQAHALDPDHVDAAINLAGAYILLKRFRLAVQVLEPLRTAAADNAMLWTNLGAAYLGNPVLADADRQQQAIAAFENALAVNPATPHVAYNLGLIYRDRGDRRQAEHWFHRALATNPGDRDASNLLRRMQETDSQEETHE